MNTKLIARILSGIMVSLLLIGTAASCITIITDEPGAGTNQPPQGQIPPAPPRGPTGTINTGASVAIASQTVNPTGGTIAVQKPGDPLDGLQIIVPPSSYPAARPFQISSAPVTSHSFGQYFNPITPLISIENGGGYSEELVKVKIPVQVPPDHFAMAFYYDEVTKKLEGIPLVAVESNSITIVTRHFSKLTVSAIANSVLDALVKAEINSNFKPGVDDWQFENWGSYIAKGGHCAGQSLSALWYFCVQPDGAGAPLYGRYDNNGKKPGTPALQEDDALGYRMASCVQVDVNWDSFEYKFFKNLGGLNDPLTYKAFAYAMQLTGEPQQVHIWSNAGGGHAMIVYRISGNNLYIADPNYPGRLDRRIELINSAFKPYNSGANAQEIAAGNGKNYERIEYTAKTALIDWGKIAARWNELKAGAVGTDKFPGYDILVVDDKGQEQPLVDEFLSGEKMLKIKVKGNNFTSLFIVVRDGKSMDFDNQGKYDLNPGKNLLGVYVMGDVNNPNNRIWKYVDFKYFNVLYQPMTVSPGHIDWLPGEKYTFTAKASNPPPNVRYDWSVDGKQMQSSAKNSFTTEFATEGTHDITAKMFDAAGKLSAEARALASPPTKTIVPPSANRLALLQKTVTVGGNLAGKDTYKRWSATTGEQLYTPANWVNSFGIPLQSIDGKSQIPITWSGTTFSGKYTWGTAQAGLVQEVSGTVSPDGNTLISLISTYQRRNYGTNWTSESNIRVELKNMPLTSPSKDAVNARFENRGADIQKYVSKIESSDITLRNGQKESSNTFVSRDWTFPETYLAIEFRGP